MQYRKFDARARDQVIDLIVDGGVDTRRGRDYRADTLLENAVNTSLAVGRPLLVSGEPGCGKTELGFAIARKLGISRLRFFPVKSDSDARSLFYTYDALRHFHGAQIAAAGGRQPPAGDLAPEDPRRYLQYRALGRAILDAYPPGAVGHLLGPDEQPQEERSVVIIDEIDKASRDFPNDLLNEIDQLWFEIPELAGWATPPESPKVPLAPELRPVIVITSNLERQLPDAFLRRCVFHHIRFPDPDTLNTIVLGHLRRLGLPDPQVAESIDLVLWARSQRLDKAPGISELLEFVRALAIRADDFEDRSFAERARANVATLGKTTRDLQVLNQHLDGL